MSSDGFHVLNLSTCQEWVLCRNVCTPPKISKPSARNFVTFLLTSCQPNFAASPTRFLCFLLHWFQLSPFGESVPMQITRHWFISSMASIWFPAALQTLPRIFERSHRYVTWNDCCSFWSGYPGPPPRPWAVCGTALHSKQLLALHDLGSWVPVVVLLLRLSIHAWTNTRWSTLWVCSPHVLCCRRWECQQQGLLPYLTLLPAPVVLVQELVGLCCQLLHESQLNAEPPISYIDHHPSREMMWDWPVQLHTCACSGLWWVHCTSGIPQSQPAHSECCWHSLGEIPDLSQSLPNQTLCGSVAHCSLSRPCPALQLEGLSSSVVLPWLSFHVSTFDKTSSPHIQKWPMWPKPENADKVEDLGFCHRCCYCRITLVLRTNGTCCFLQLTWKNLPVCTTWPKAHHSSNAHQTLC